MNCLRRRISDLTQAENFFLRRCRIVATQSPKSIIKPLAPIQFFREYETQIPPGNGEQITWPRAYSVFSEKEEESQRIEMDPGKKWDFEKALTALKDEILINSEVAETVLVEKGVEFFRKYGYGAVIAELLSQLRQTSPQLAIQVLNWRRKQCQSDVPMDEHEYGMGIYVASRSSDINLSVELYNEAWEKGLMGTRLYNALMSAYVYNGQHMKCISLYRQLKDDFWCIPNTLSYNIVISALGRVMLIDQMEAVFSEMNEQNQSPTMSTYKGLIIGYITAWMWDAMEKTYLMMKNGPIKPDRDIHLLMLRGYAYSDNLEKMEEMYAMVKEHVDVKAFQLIRCMICAYCRSSRVDKVAKVEELAGLIPEHAYKPWLNVLLITLYANENLLEQMEKSMTEAFQHKTRIRAVRVMRCISASYYRQNAVDKLAEFLQRSSSAGWRTCPSLYHCKMVMYALQNRLSEMEMVVEEMNKINMPLSKKTLLILYKAYQKWGERYNLEKVMGLMCKNGYGIPLDYDNS